MLNRRKPVRGPWHISYRSRILAEGFVCPMDSSLPSTETSCRSEELQKPQTSHPKSLNQHQWGPQNQLIVEDRVKYVRV